MWNELAKAPGTSRNWTTVRKLLELACRAGCNDAVPLSELPTGTVTLLFTDVENSTELVKRLGERYAATLAEHRDLLRRAFEQNGGVEVDTPGRLVPRGVRDRPRRRQAAVAAQRALAAQEWDAGLEVRVRMGLHTCEPHRAEHGYVGVGVHRGARICTVAHGGQVLLSRSTAGIVDDFDLSGVSLLDLGEHRLKDIERPERIYQAVANELPGAFPALQTIDQQVQLAGTVTVVMAEGRRVLRLIRELQSEIVGALLGDYRRVLQDVFERHGGHEIEVSRRHCGRVVSDGEGSRGGGSRRPARGAGASLAARARPRDQRRRPFRNGRDRLDRACDRHVRRVVRRRRGWRDLSLPGRSGPARGGGPGRALDQGRRASRRPGGAGSPSAPTSSSIRDEFLPRARSYR